MATLADLLTSKIPPHSLEAERAALGALLLEQEAWPRGLEILCPTDFYKESHRKIFTAMARTVEASGAVDIVTLSEALHQADQLEEIGGPAALGQLVEEAAILPNLDQYAAIVREKAKLRDLIRIGTEIIGRAYENSHGPAELFALAQAQLEALGHDAARAGRARLPVTLAQLAAAPPIEPRWLVEGLLLEAANGWIGAGAKVGKSYLALDLLLACCLGVPWLDHFAIARPLTVVLVEEEDSAWRVYQRATRLCAGRGVAMPERFHVHIRTGLQLDDPATLNPFLRWLGAQHVDLVVWDVFNKLHTKDEKRPDQMLPILKRVDRIRDELGCANLIAHHSRKPGTHGPDLASGGQKLRGPSEFWGWSENSLYLSPLTGKGTVRVEPESKDAIVEPFKAHLEDLDDGARRWVYDGVVQSKTAQAEATRAAIVEALRDRPQQTASQVAEAVGLSEKQVKRHLKTLREDDAVAYDTAPDRAHTRLWSLTERGHDAVPF